MKIESFGQIKEIEQIQIPGLIAPKFTEGEILIARVVQIEGGKVFLNNKNGNAFIAFMQNDLGLSEGDIVEVVANGNGRGYTLNLLDIEHAQNSAYDKAAMSSRDTVSGTLAMIKANPGLNPKSASFLVENGIPGSQENVSALGNIVHGAGLGTLLAELLTGISIDNIPDEDSIPVAAGIKEEAALEDTSAAKAGSLKNNTDEGSAEKGAARLAPGQENTAAPTGNTTVKGSAQPAGNTGENISPNTAAASGESVETLPEETQQKASSQAGALLQEAAELPQASVPKEGVEIPGTAVPAKGGSNEPANTPVQTGTAAQQLQEQPLPKTVGQLLEMLLYAEPEAAYSAGRPKSYSKEEIILAIKDVFCRPEEQTGAELKKAISEMPDKLDRLKLLLHNSDNRDKGVFVQKAEEAQKQLEVMSGAKKFDYVQIPLLLKDGQARTAELYVYRRNRNQSETVEGGITILLALDTETIGRVETLIKASGSKISLEFRLEHRELQQEIKRKAKSLAQKIENAGYRLKEIRLTGLETKTTVLNAGGLLQDAGARQETIDVQI